jgi:hypothetical protein
VHRALVVELHAPPVDPAIGDKGIEDVVPRYIAVRPARFLRHEPDALPGRVMVFQPGPAVKSARYLHWFKPVRVHWGCSVASNRAISCRAAASMRARATARAPSSLRYSWPEAQLASANASQPAERQGERRSPVRGASLHHMPSVHDRFDGNRCPLTGARPARCIRDAGAGIGNHEEEDRPAPRCKQRGSGAGRRAASTRAT